MQSVLNEESFIGSFTKIINNTKKYANKNKNNGTSAAYLNGSISKYTKDLIMSFPMLCDDTISIDTAQMISKANEQNIVTMLKLLFTSLSVSGDTGVEVLKKFHKNMNVNMIDDIIDAIDDIAANEGAEYALSKAEIRQTLLEMRDQLKVPAKSFPASSFNERSLNDYAVRNVYGKSVVNELQVDPNIANAMEDDDSYNSELDSIDKMYDTYDKDERDRRVSKYKLLRDEQDREVKSGYDAAKNRREEAKNRREEEELGMKRDSASRDRQRDFNDLATKMIADGDVKKANELQPTLMIINMNTLDSNDHVSDRVSFTAGVKSRIIVAEAMDIVERLVAKNKTKLSFKNLVRATTGEISFVKDFLLSIKQAKISARNAVKKGGAAMMWNALERRSMGNAINKIKRDGNDATCITTLVINQETVNYMKNAFKFDLTKISNVKQIMEAYNLLGLVIADESNEVAKFLYDGNDTFETLSYAALSKDAKSKELKQAMDIVAKMGR